MEFSLVRRVQCIWHEVGSSTEILVIQKTPLAVFDSGFLASRLEDIVKISGIKRKEGIQYCLNEVSRSKRLVIGLSLYRTQNFKIFASTCAINLFESFSLEIEDVGNGRELSMDF